MKTVDLPWGAWYGDGSPHTVQFPEGWTVDVCSMRGGQDIGDDGIRQRLGTPTGSPTVGHLAAESASAAILLDDLSRPTPAFRLLPYLLEELSEGGIADDQITMIAAVAAHRPMTRDDFIKKVGGDVVDRYRVVNHNAYENLEFLGNSSQGVPIFVNRDFMGCQLRIALGMITPRGGFFGGGAKLLIPGACEASRPSC
jgi:nickel-dependent lactate racemase